MNILDQIWQYQENFDTSQLDPTEPLTATGVRKLKQTDGTDVDIVVPNDMANTHWNNPVDTFGEPGFIQFIEAGGFILPSMTDNERVTQYKQQVAEFIDNEGEILRKLIVAKLENRLALDKKEIEAQKFHDGLINAGNAAREAPFAFSHSAFRLQLYQNANVPNPPTRIQLAINILKNWHNEFTYFNPLLIRIDAVIEQGEQWGLQLSQVNTIEKVLIIKQAAINEYALIKTDIEKFNA